MRKLLVPFGVFVYFAVYFVDAQSLHDSVDKVDIVDDSFEEVRHGKRRPIEPKLTERDDDSDDRETTDLATQSSEERNSTDDMQEEFKNDLKTIGNFAQSVGPIATNMRRSLHIRRSLSLNVGAVMQFVKDTLLSIIDSSDKYIPHLIPITKILRRFVMKIFEN